MGEWEELFLCKLCQDEGYITSRTAILLTSTICVRWHSMWVSPLWAGLELNSTQHGTSFQQIPSNGTRNQGHKTVTCSWKMHRSLQRPRASTLDTDTPCQHPSPSQTFPLHKPGRRWIEVLLSPFYRSLAMSTCAISAP